MNDPFSRSTGPLASPGHRLWTTAARWKSVVRDALHPHGLTPTQFFVLGAVAWLSRAEAPNQREIADFAGLDLMTTSQVVRALEAMALVSRSSDPRDSRSWRVMPTRRGVALVKSAAVAVRTADERFFGDHATTVARTLALLDT